MGVGSLRRSWAGNLGVKEGLKGGERGKTGREVWKRVAEGRDELEISQIFGEFSSIFLSVRVVSGSREGGGGQFSHFTGWASPVSLK